MVQDWQKYWKASTKKPSGNRCFGGLNPHSYSQETCCSSDRSPAITADAIAMKTSKIDSTYGVIKKINSICATISGLILFFVSLSIFVDIILRYFFHRPTIWITEVSTYLFLYIIFFVTSYALQEDFHIKATFFYDFLTKRAKRTVNLVTSLFSISFVFVMLWQTSRMTWKAVEGSWTSPTVLNVPYAYVYPAMVFGSFMLLITYILKAIFEFISRKT